MIVEKTSGTDVGGDNGARGIDADGKRLSSFTSTPHSTHVSHLIAAVLVYAQLVASITFITVIAFRMACRAMTGSITFAVHGTPVAKGRPRIPRHGHPYTPQKTRQYDALVGTAANEAMAGLPPLDGPLRAVIQIELPVPASWSKKKAQAAILGNLQPIARPDLDNFLKAVLDGCNAIVFYDDSQVVQIDARKLYGIDPKVVITILPLTDEVYL